MPSNQPTKAEIEGENAELQAQLAEQQRIIDELQKQVDAGREEKLEILKAQEGWLVTAPNPLFNEAMMGVVFRNGQAFIRKTQTVEAFAFEPGKIGTHVKFLASQYPDPAYDAKYRQQKLEEILEREAIPSSERAAMAFQSDHGFQVVYYSAEDQDALNRTINRRTQEARQAEEMQQAHNMADQLVPGYRGG